ncbi:MAG: hypothetical protein H7338_02580, partial [Candidatus Sericytochromatia bacterium]|nr:hypothetical protein [Candidatus Sericytochromatia bacterium]
MIDANRPLGFDPTLTGPHGVPPKPVTASGHPPQTAVAESSALRPHDGSDAHTFQATHFGLAGAHFQDLSEASVEDTRHFVSTQQNQPITSLAMVDSHVLVASGGHLIRMRLVDLGRAMSTGNLRPDSALARALVVHESAVSAGLSFGATRAIMKSYSTALHTMNPHDAHLVAMTNISTAVEVEAYVSNKTGLASDVRRVAGFTKDAFDSNTAGGALAAIRNRTLKAEVVKQHQGWLDTNLHGFTDAFATARETGNYALAFDRLQTFFAVSAKVTDTDYWKNRPQTVLAALEPESTAPRQHVAPTRFAEMLFLHASPAPAAKALSLPTRSHQAAEGGFFSNLYARMADFFQAPPDTAGTGALANYAQCGLDARLAGLDQIACTGHLYRAPEPLPAPLPRAPMARAEARPSLGIGPQPVALTEPSAPAWRTGVAKMKDGDPGTIEPLLIAKLNRLKVGDKCELAGAIGAGIGVKINAIDFIPVAGKALSAAGVEAALSATVAGGGEKSAQLTLLEHGRVAMRVLTEVAGGVKMGAEAGMKPIGLSIGKEAGTQVGHRAIISMPSSSIADAAKWLAHPIDHGGVVPGDDVGDKRFTATSRLESFAETTFGTETTIIVPPSQKSSLSILPGMRTTVSEATERHLLSDTGDRAAELSFRLSTYAGKSSDAPIASEVSLTAIKSAGQIAEPTVSLSLSIDKLENLVKRVPDGDTARERILDKLAERLTETLEKANAEGFDGTIETGDVRTRLDAALRTLQAGA